MRLFALSKFSRRTRPTIGWTSTPPWNANMTSVFATMHRPADMQPSRPEADGYTANQEGETLMSKPNKKEGGVQGNLFAPDNIRAFMLANNATVTFVSKETGKRFTYFIERAKTTQADGTKKQD